MSITELMAKKAKAWDDAKAFLEAHISDGILSAEDEATYNKMVEVVDDYDKKINLAKDAEARDAALNAPVNKPIVSAPGKVEDKTGRASDEYKKAFDTFVRSKGKVVTNAMQEDTNSEGGYLVPTEFEEVLYRARDAVDPIFRLAGKIFLGSKEKNVPFVASEGAAALITEEGAYGDTDDSFGQVTFHAYKFGRICKVSEELLADSVVDLPAHIAESLGRSIGKAEAAYFYTGTGTNQPQGILAAAGTGVTTAAADAITADEIIDLYYSLDEEYRDNAVFIFHNSTIKEIRKLKDGEGQYLWAPGFEGRPATLLGRPLYTSKNMEQIGAGKKVGIFGDIAAGYKIADRSGFEFRVLTELYAANGQVGFRGRGRTDGRGILASDAIKSLVMHA